MRKMEEGLYKVTFQTPLGQGTGVVVLRGGQVSGGDSLMYYTGSYTLTDGQIDAQLLTDTHSNTPGMGSVLGVPKARLRLTGKFSGQSAQLSGSSPDAPGISFQALLDRLAD
jgi:hypothetical protein